MTRTLENVIFYYSKVQNFSTFVYFPNQLTFTKPNITLNIRVQIIHIKNKINTAECNYKGAYAKYVIELKNSTAWLESLIWTFRVLHFG